jgi:hypothetical protein
MMEERRIAICARPADVTQRGKVIPKIDYQVTTGGALGSSLLGSTSSAPPEMESSNL